MNLVNINIGCGSRLVKGYINFDNFEKPSITLTVDDVSTEYKEYVKINWEISESNYFYQYEIRRYKDEQGATIEKITQIPDREINHFLDREVDDTYPGTTKFYRLYVVYINEDSEFSDIIPGNSLP